MEERRISRGGNKEDECAGLVCNLGLYLYGEMEAEIGRV